jgi:hypothetical protein
LRTQPCIVIDAAGVDLIGKPKTLHITAFVVRVLKLPAKRARFGPMKRKGFPFDEGID